MNYELLRQKTYFDQNDDFADMGAGAIRHVIITFRSIYNQFWNRDPFLIVESLNQNVQLALGRFERNTLIGEFHNALAAEVGIEERIPVTMPPNFYFDTELDLFFYNAPAAPTMAEEILDVPVEPVDDGQNLAVE